MAQLDERDEGAWPVAPLSPPTREDRRSVAFHRAIAKKLRSQPAKVVEKAKRNLAKFPSVINVSHPWAAQLVSTWRRWLALPPDELARRIVEEDGWPERDMRQSSPFAGVLTEQERYKVLAEFRRAEEGRLAPKSNEQPAVEQASRAEGEGAGDDDAA